MITAPEQTPFYEGTPLPEEVHPAPTPTPPTSSTMSPPGSEVYYSNGSVYMVQGEPSQQAPQPLPTSLAPSVPYSTAGGGVYGGGSPLLPAYRPAPDYDTVMQHFSQQAQQQSLDHALQLAYLGNIRNSHVYSQPELMAYSQPEIHHLHTAQYQHMGDLVTSNIPANGVIHPSHYPLRPVDRANSLIIYPTYSSPEQGPVIPENQFSTSDHMLNAEYSYKPPPPYPRAASSTPDLATQTMKSGIGTSNPDLIPLIVTSRLDQSVENLALDTPRLQRSQQHMEESRPAPDDSSSIQSEALLRTPTPVGLPDVASSHPSATPQSSLESPAQASSGPSASSSGRSLQQYSVLQALGVDNFAFHDFQGNMTSSFGSPNFNSSAVSHNVDTVTPPQQFRQQQQHQQPTIPQSVSPGEVVQRVTRRNKTGQDDSNKVRFRTS